MVLYFLCMRLFYAKISEYLDHCIDARNFGSDYLLLFAIWKVEEAADG